MLELGWTILPAVILAFVAVGTLTTLFDLDEEPEDALEIDVVGQQWWWDFQYDVDGDGEPTTSAPRTRWSSPPGTRSTSTSRRWT